MCMKSFIIFKHLSSILFLTIIILSSSPPQTNACVAQHLLMRHFWQTAEVESHLKELLSSPDWPVVESAIQAGVERANSRAVSNVANIKKWTVLPREFSVDGGELGPSLKLKRFHVVDMYRDTIENMYGDEE